MDFFNPPFFFSDPGIPTTYSSFTFLIAKGFAQIIDFSKGGDFGRFSRGGILALSSVVVVYLTCLMWISKQISGSLVSDLDSKFKKLSILSGVFMAMAISYPSIFAIDRGNYVLLAFVFLFLSQEYGNKLLWSGLCLATAIAIKTYFGLLLVTGLLRRNFKLVFVTCCFLLLEIVMGALILSNDPQSFLMYVMSFYTPSADVYSGWGLAQKMAWNSHFLNLIYAPIIPKIYVFYGADNDIIHAWVAWIDKLYLLAVFFPGIIILPTLIARRASDPNLAFFYTVITIILLTPFMGNYTLIFLFIFVPRLLVQPNGWVGTLTLVVLACALVPKVYITLFISGQMRVTLQSIINPILLVTLLIIFMFETSKKQRI
jgi:hypothetical protein